MTTTQYAKPRRDNLVVVAGYDNEFMVEVFKYNVSTDVYIVADITGGSLTMIVYDENDNIVYTETGSISGDPVNGIFDVTFEDTEVEIGAIGMYRHETSYTEATGLKFLICYGTFEVWHPTVD